MNSGQTVDTVNTVLIDPDSRHYYCKPNLRQNKSDSRHTVVTDTKYLCEQKPQAESIYMIKMSASMYIRGYNVRHKVLTWEQRHTQRTYVGTRSNTKYLRGHNVSNNLSTYAQLQTQSTYWAYRQTQSIYVSTTSDTKYLVNNTSDTTYILNTTSDTTYVRGHNVRNSVLN